MKEKEAKGPQMDIPLTESTQKTKSIRVENRKKRDSSRTEGDPQSDKKRKRVWAMSQEKKKCKGGRRY